MKEQVFIDYTNHRGERAKRRIAPIHIVFGSNQYHEGEQWFLFALDLDKSAERLFAMRDIHSWGRD